MANVLKFGGAKTTSFSEVSLVGDFTLICDIAIYSNGGMAFSGGNGAGGMELYRNNSAKATLFISGSAVITGSTTLSSDTLNPDEITITRSGSTIELLVNGVSQGTHTDSSALRISLFGDRVGGGFDADMWLYGVSITGLHDWDPNASDFNSDPVTLVDTIGGNNAVSSNMPTDGRVWESTTVTGIVIDNDDYSFQKANGASATHTITGSYAGTPTSIEYSIDGGAYQTGVANPAGEAFSFDVVIPIGESTVDVRFSNETTTSDSVILATPALTVAVAVTQSNGSGRGINNQTYTQTGSVKAYLFGNDDNFKLLQDPYDSTANQVDDISKENTGVGGSWLVRFAHYWIQSQGTPIAFIPCAKGGSTIQQWQKDDTTNVVNGLNLYQSMARRLALTGGCDVVFSQIGETDSDIDTTISTYETKANQVYNDIKSDFGADTFVIPLQTITAGGFDGNGTTTGQDAIRQAQINVANSNANVSIGQSLTDIDISDNDGLHFWRDDELDLIGSRMYDSFTGEVSNLTITATGIPDGIYNTVLVNSSNEIVHAGNVTYSSGQALLENLALTSGTPLTGFVVDNEISHSNGAVITGTTV